MVADKKSLILYFDIREPIGLLDDEECGQLFRAVLDYAENGTLPNFEGALQMAFAFIKKAIDRDTAKWEDTCRKRSEAGRSGGIAKAERQHLADQANATFTKQSWQNSTKLADNVPVPVPVPEPVIDIVPESNNTGASKGMDRSVKKSPHFIPPTLEEVETYCQERKNGIDPLSFINFYEAKGWMIGRNKMQDWKAAVRTWETKQKPKGFAYNDQYEEGESL